MRLPCVGLVFAIALHAQHASPVVGAWIVNPAAATANDALLKVLPNVHSVRLDGDFVSVVSAGISLQSLGALEAGGWEPMLGPREFVFRLPRTPRRAEGESRLTPLGMVGAFLNGVPIYTPVSAVSWKDQNLWHLDAVASRQKVCLGPSPLLSSLLENSDIHSPLIGFALDGFPVYGPYGWDAAGRVTRFRSSYRLRSITRRETLPDGTELTPSQEGPPVNSEYPLGSFAEDYDYVDRSGDLDVHNGRFARTPQYPEGSYAYFLSTDAEGAIQYPYLIGRSYYGQIPRTVQPASTMLRSDDMELRLTQQTQAGHPVDLRFVVRDAKGNPIRFLEKVHEQPIHLAIVSSDLAEFAHVHPVIQPDDSYVVSHTFARGGSYWLYADHTPPGGAQTISRFRIDVKGNARPSQGPLPETPPGLEVTLVKPASIYAGQDVSLRFDIAANDLEPYLGAWAHFMILSEDGEEFIHAHPVDDAATIGDSNPWQHSHAGPGPSPSSVSTITGFRKPGTYRLWAQFQRQGNVVTIPYTLKVLPAKLNVPVKVVVPAGAIAVNVSTSGFTPARITAVAGKPTVLALRRDDARSCASSVVFPELGIRKDLPVGQTVLIGIPASGAGTELHFSCGMNMYRGSLLITRAD